MDDICATDVNPYLFFCRFVSPPLRKKRLCAVIIYVRRAYINYGHLSSGDVSDILRTIMHEMHHAFVYYTLSTLNFESDEVKNSYYYQKAREWKENSKNYIHSSVSFDEYMNQPIEADARAYAEERAAVYKDYIKVSEKRKTG